MRCVCMPRSTESTGGRKARPNKQTNKQTNKNKTLRKFRVWAHGMHLGLIRREGVYYSSSYDELYTHQLAVG